MVNGISSKGLKKENLKVEGYVLHAPIRINSNEDFTSENGVVSGSGTKDDPYIISGWEIDAHGAGTAICIGNTTAYFVVEDCYLQNTSYEYSPYSEGTGILLYNVTNGAIENNIIFKNPSDGIDLEYSHNDVILNNTIKNNYYGIYFYLSSNNTVTENIVFNNTWGGIDLDSSFNNTLKGNVMKKDGIVLEGGDKRTFTTQYIGIDNVVNGKPVYYYKNLNMNNSTVPTNAGEVIIGNVSWLTIKNLNISSASDGIEIGYSMHINIINNSVFNNNGDGIAIYSSYINGIINNTLFDNKGYSIVLYSSFGNTIASNTVYRTKGWGGIGLFSSSNNTLTSNTIHHNNHLGIEIEFSYNNTIINNIIFYNREYGIYLDWGSSLNVIYNNSFYYNYGSGDIYNSSNIQGYNNYGNNFWNSTNGIGNYWHDWANNNNSNDKNGDGIVDWAYVIDGSGGAKDYYPLKKPLTPVPKLTPTAPRDLKAKAGIGYVNLSWKKPVGQGTSNISEYKIYRNGTLIETVPATQLWYNDTNIVPEVNYSYYVTAVNSVGESQPSNNVKATPTGTIPEFSGVWMAIIAIIALCMGITYRKKT